MHMVMVIGGGIVLMGLFVLFGHLWGANAAAMGLAARWFIPVWLVGTWREDDKHANAVDAAGRSRVQRTVSAIA